MELAKGLSFISLFAALAALLIIVMGQQDNVKGLIGTDEKAREEVYSESFLGEANLTKDSGDIETLMRLAILDTSGFPEMSKAELQGMMIKDEPSIPLGQPIAKGGVSMDMVKNRRGESVVVFCSKPTVEYVCGAVNIISRTQQLQTYKVLGKQHIALARSL